MKKTRNLFVLKSSNNDFIQLVLQELQFKGLTVLDSKFVDVQDIKEVFNNNKSVVCYNIPKVFEQNAIPITIIDNNVPDNIQYNIDSIDIAQGNICTQFEKIAEIHNCDIGDHKSNSSGLTSIPSKKHCGYCNYLNGKDTNYPNRTVYESSNFFVMPTLGEFVCGYLLIIPKQHVMSNAELELSIEKEFLSVLEDIVYILNLTYNTSHVLVWENGTGNSGIGKAKDSVVHAHTHIAPSNLDANQIQIISGFSFKEISTTDISLYGKHSYLLIKGEDDDNWIINDDENLYIPRQYIRQLLAEEYSISGEQWNWRIYPFKDSMYKTRNDILSTLKNNWDKLPKRIKENTKKFLV